MTCFTRCGGFCYPTTPRPIFIFGDCDEGNSIINPILPTSFGYFVSTGGTATANSIIPLTLASSRGSKITQSTTLGAITLTPGEYEITYSVNSTIPAGGTASVALYDNGALLPNSTTTVSGTAGNNVALTKTVVLTVLSTSTLSLQNTTASNFTYLNANVLVKEI